MAASNGDGPRVAPILRPRPLRMLLVTASWGVCFYVIRLGLRDASPLWFAAIRALIAGGALTVLAMTQRRPRPRGVRVWGLIGLMGVINVTLAFAAMFLGIDGLATGTAAVLANAQPILILVPAWVLFGEVLAARVVAGVVLGFVGLLIVAVPGGGGHGALLSILAAAAITSGTLLSRGLQESDIVHVAGWHFVIGGVLLLGVAGVLEGGPSVDWTPRFVISLAFLGLVGTAATFWAWFTEVRRCPVSQVAAWTLLVPVFGVLFGSVLAAERPGGWELVGLAMVLASMPVVVGGPLPGLRRAPS